MKPYFQRLSSKKFIVVLALISLLTAILALPFQLMAEEEAPTPETVRGKVLEITENKEKQQEVPDTGDGFAITYYKVKIKVLSGIHRGETIDAEHVIDQRMVYNLKVDPGDQVLIYLEEDEQQKVVNAYIAEIYRQNYLLYLLVLFLLSLILVGGLKGLKTILTLGLTGVAVFKVLLPGLLAGYNPLLLTVAICAAVTALTLFIVSGINMKSVSAILGTTGGVMVAGIIALIFGNLAKLTGLGEQEAQMLMFIPQKTGFDFQGLLFAGIILGALGAVMDVGMSIASSMHEIQAVKPDIKTKELIKSGMNVGRDVMGTMSNTLILAYAGASMPMLLLFLAHDIPVHEFLNWDLISSEIVRSFAGSIGLILTIPLTALVTAALRGKHSKNSQS